MLYRLIAFLIICGFLYASIIYQRDTLAAVRENKVLSLQVILLQQQVRSFRTVLGTYGKITEGNLLSANATWSAIQTIMKEKRVRAKIRKEFHE